MQNNAKFKHLNLPIPDNSDGSIWVFGYASLIWNPGFKYTEACRAQVMGYHRSFCVWSTTYRGTPESPGLVMGLDQGGTCDGKAFKLDMDCIEESLIYLYDREMDTLAYHPTVCPIQLCHDASNTNVPNQTIEALTFVVNASGPVYASGLTPKEKAKLINQSHGSRGPNREYVLNTFQHLVEMGIEDNYLRSIVDEL